MLACKRTLEEPGDGSARWNDDGMVETVYTFDDDTSLIVIGRGIGHSAKTELP